MFQKTCRICLTALTTAAAVAAPLLLGVPAVLAQSELRTGEDVTHIAIVKGADVYVRCGAAESYYPCAKVNPGDMVKVTGEKFEWSRVLIMGPAFQNVYGYIKYPKGESGRFRLAADGKSGVTLGKTDVIAPNLDAKGNSKDSWKPIVRLEADQTLRVIETTETDKETIQKVALPDGAQGWVSSEYLEAATPEQVKQWTEMLAHPSKPVAESTKTAAAPKSSPSAGGDDPANKVHSNKPAAVTTPTGQKPGENSPAAAPDQDAATNEPATATGDNAAKPTEPSTTPAPDTTTPKAPEPKKLPTLDDLENAFKVMQKEAVETAEVGPLRDLYLDLATRSAGEARTARYARGRAEQLQILTDAQKHRAELNSFRTRTKMSAAETEAVQKALESSAQYTAVGRIAASTIYDGKSLPQLLRVQDPATGRTIAYLKPDAQYEAVNLIGNLVGIVGDKNFDEALRLNIITPKRVDVLMPADHGTAVTTGTER